MKITGLNKEGKEVYFAGYTNEETAKGLGSGALTGTNRVPYFSTNEKDAKKYNDLHWCKKNYGRNYWLNQIWRNKRN